MYTQLEYFTITIQKYRPTLWKLIAGGPRLQISKNFTTHFHLLTPLPFNDFNQNAQNAIMFMIKSEEFRAIIHF